jgi:hypothetical protein
VSEIRGSHELRGSQGESPGVGYFKSQNRERRSREAPKPGTRDTWQNHKGGPGKTDRWTRVAKRKGVNTSLTSRFSGVRKVRARRHDVETREGARGERSQ